MTVVIGLMLVTVYLLTPLGFILGWTRFIQTWREFNPARIFSLTGFAFATASALLAIFSITYAQEIGGFSFYDPRLLRFLRTGSLLSLAAITLSLGGVWKRGPLRWLSPACSLGTLLFWLGAAMGE
jgi:hypothetical protein